MSPTTTTTAERGPTRAEVLAAAERLRRAATLLERHAARCTAERADAHGRALRVARGMVRQAVCDTS